MPGVAVAEQRDPQIAGRKRSAAPIGNRIGRSHSNPAHHSLKRTSKGRKSHRRRIVAQGSELQRGPKNAGRNPDTGDQPLPAGGQFSQFVVVFVGNRALVVRHSFRFVQDTMWNPGQPIEGRRPDRFRPPHCPRTDCPDHRYQGPGYRAARDGSYRRACDPLRRIPRFRCPTCKRGFSRQSFATSYYLKRPELLHPVAGLLIAGSAHRQIARHLGCAPSTVTRLSVRLGRHAGLLHEVSMARLERIDEPVVFDHFETFVRSQQERLGIATAVGQRSWFVYAVGGARYRGTSRRSRRKRRLKLAPRPTTAGAVVASTRKTLESLLRKSPDGLDLISDEHPAYRAAVHRINRKLSAAKSIRHATYANPDRSPGHDFSRARQRNQAMFAVDLLHKLLRHCQAHHRRETIAFGRKSTNVIGRALLFAIWRNFIKRISERRPTHLSPAMQVGLTSKLWTWRDVLAVRLFPGRLV